MAKEMKNLSYVKDVLRTALTTATAYPGALGNVVLVGVRAGVVITPQTDLYGVAINHASIDFDPSKFWNVADQIDVANLPVVGGKIYYIAATGKLASTNTGVFVGTYWGTDGDAHIVSLGL